MGIFVKGQLHRFERKLRSSMERGERLLDFDIGRFDDGRKVTCFASTHALYAMFPGGTTMRLPYGDIAALDAEPELLVVDTAKGRHFEFRFTHARPGFTTALKEQSAGRTAQQFTATWGSCGARFHLASDGSISATELGEWSDVIQLTNTMLMEQAWGELEVSLGQPPSLQYEHPRPSWMPEFSWEPPLPDAAARATG